MTERKHNHDGNEIERNQDLHEDLCAYLLGELDGTDAARIEAALADSPALREERDRIEATIGLVRSACGGGESLSPEILSTLESAARPALRPRPWYTNTPLRLAAGIAALAGGILGGKALMQEPPTPEKIALARLEAEIRDSGEALRRGRDAGVRDFDVEVAQGAVVTDALRDKSEFERQVEGIREGLAQTEPMLVNSPVTPNPETVYLGKAGGDGGVSTIDLNGFGPGTGNPEFAAPGAAGSGGQVKLQSTTRPYAGAPRGVFRYDDQGKLAEGTTNFPNTPNVKGQGGIAPGRETSNGLSESGSAELPKELQALGYLDGGGGGGGGGAVDVRPDSSVDIRGRRENRFDRSLEGTDRYLGEKLVSTDGKAEGKKSQAPDEAAAVEYARGARPADKALPGLATIPEATAAAPGGGGPSAPGPAGPSTSGPASKRVPAATAGVPLGEPVASNEAGKMAETMDRLSELGYSAGEADLPGSDDFFLGRGQKHPAGAQGRYRYDHLTPEQFDELCRHRVDRILTDCRRRPQEKPSMMFFRYWGDNAFELAQIDNQSTFGVDVDTASYALARRYLADGYVPEKAQIRTEEFVNYFKPDVPAPTEETFAIHTDLAPSRFGGTEGIGSQRLMMRVVVRGKEVSREERSPLALTFVVDTSGSMKENNRLELVKHALRLLLNQLDANDSIAIVAFSREARLVLPMTSAGQRGVIEAALYGLNPNGGTNAESGLRLGYEIATAGLTKGATNRVVFLSDGVANIGQTDQDRLNADVKRNRDLGIYLNTIGVGLSNHNDVFLEQLANKGDGLCNYVDGPEEAKRALVDNFVSAFEPIARDVKVQVEFDKTQVYRYRLLGYENRAIADADFRNDAIDAGEIGAGHQVVALYELELSGTQSTEPLASVRLRWKDPIGVGRDPLEDTAQEVSQPVFFSEATSWEGASDGYKRSVLVAQFAEILRRSVHARGDSLDDLIAETAKLASHMGDPDLVEFHAMLQKSRDLIIRTTPRYDDLTLCIDALRRNQILRAQYDELRHNENRAVIDELERQNQQLEARIRELIRNEMR